MQCFSPCFFCCVVLFSSNASKYTLLQMALMLQKKKVVEYLLPQQDLDLNTKATDGTTALMTACDQQARANSSISCGLL